mmetsp:Transcript_21103/g.56839  ORF Transcript_21103/g.56839 Transcript_21103/m.56839 type:complete len:256 (+) Transcript_21103:440-1207(+)
MRRPSGPASRRAWAALCAMAALVNGSAWRRSNHASHAAAGTVMPARPMRRTNAAKKRWLDAATHVPTQGQWWSKRRKQRSQVLQWEQRGGLQRWQVTHHLYTSPHVSVVSSYSLVPSGSSSSSSGRPSSRVHRAREPGSTLFTSARATWASAASTMRVCSIILLSSTLCVMLGWIHRRAAVHTPVVRSTTVMGPQKRMACLSMHSLHRSRGGWSPSAVREDRRDDTSTSPRASGLEPGTGGRGLSRPAPSWTMSA